MLEYVGKLAKEVAEIANTQQEPEGSEKYIEVMNIVLGKISISRMMEEFEKVYSAFPSDWTLQEVRQHLEDSSVKCDERIRKALDRKEE